MHESKMHAANSFITLTYDDKYLPKDNSIDVRVWQLFMKRLRKSLPQKIRFFACGEYGDINYRPHYHALIFNHDFPDKKVHSRPQGNPLYTSEALQELWPYGFSTVGNLTYQTAAYTARYSIKKIGGDRAADHYLRPHPLTGQLHQVKPEAGWMSRRPGLGATWLEKHHSDVFPSDFIIVDGKRHPIPNFYTNRLLELEQTKLKRARKRSALKRKEDSTPARLKVREEVQLERAKRLKRQL